MPISPPKPAHLPRSAAHDLWSPLLNELRQRTDDLSESLEQQTATSEVLGVISSSPGDLQPVFDTILENATRICEANFGNLVLVEGDGFRFVAERNAPAAYADVMRRNPVLRPPPEHSFARAAKSKREVHILDVSADPSKVFEAVRRQGRVADRGHNRAVAEIGLGWRECRGRRWQA